MHLGAFVHVVENPHDAKHGRGIDSLAESFVVEADVAAGDWNIEVFAGLGDAVDGLRELPHNVRFFGIAEVQTIGCADGSGAGTGHLASGLGNRMHRAQSWIEVAPAAIAIERHGKATVGALNANDSGVACTGSLHGVGLHHVIVLLPDPAFAADIRAPKQVFQLARKIRGASQLNVFGFLTWNRRLPSCERTFVNGSVVGQRWVGNLGYNFAVFEHAQNVARGDPADFNGIQSPLLEDAEHFLLAAFLRDQQHAFLRFAEHDLVRSHAGLALRHAIEFDFDSHAAAAAHFAS